MGLTILWIKLRCWLRYRGHHPYMPTLLRSELLGDEVREYYDLCPRCGASRLRLEAVPR